LRGLSQPTTYVESKPGDVGDSEDEYPSTDDDSRCGEDDVVDNLSLDDEIPRQIDTVDVDDDGNPTFNLMNKIYQDRSMWARNLDGSISIGVGDMPIDKDKQSK